MKYAKIENGTVKIFNILPRIYKNIINFKKADIETINAKGFYELVIPIITEYQRLLPLEVTDLVDDKFTQRVEDFTQAEIDEYNENKETQTIRELLQQFENDGNTFYNDVKLLVKKHHTKGTITDAQFKSIRVVLEPALRPLKLGDWDIAQDNINAINRPSGTLAPLYDFVKDKIDNYLK